MDKIYLKDFNNMLSQIINAQKKSGQPIYIIASFWCGYFDGIISFSTEGEKDLIVMKEIFEKEYAWKENQIGVTEQTYRLIKLDFTEILNHKGEEKCLQNI